jgi:hypothetical protein
MVPEALFFRPDRLIYYSTGEMGFKTISNHYSQDRKPLLFIPLLSFQQEDLFWHTVEITTNLSHTSPISPANASGKATLIEFGQHK